MSNAVFIAVLFVLTVLLVLLAVFLYRTSRPKNKRESDIAGGVRLDDPLFSLTGEITGKRHYHTGTLLLKNTGRIKVSICNLRDNSEKVMYIFSQLRIGRAPAQFPHDPDAYIVENDLMVSGVHCVLINYAGYLALQDCNSKNHTYLNGTIVNELVYVNDMDHIQVGNTELVIRILS